jgi:hypothetical protein
MENIKKPEPQNASALCQINALYDMRIKELKIKYKELFGEGNPPSNRDYLLRRIAYKIQENAFGGISPEAADKIEALKNELNPIVNLGRKPEDPNAPEGAKHSKRLPLPGTIISKEYKGTPVAVKVLNKGFEYNGQVYRSLSRVAREISGVHQSGFVFFGI